MIRRQFFAFVLRWLASSIGMYFCITWLGTIDPASSAIYKYAWVLFAVAGLIFSLINSILKPLVKMLALPLAILTLGLSTIVINTVMVILTIYLLPGVEMDFWGAFLSSVIMSIINAVMNLLIN